MTNPRERVQESIADLVDEERLRVNCRVFNDPAIHAAEIERIFNRSWLFLAHESEIPNPGDYVTRPMGSDQVIVNRDVEGVVRGFLNVCRHRGMQLCRADAGQARQFVCPYHAWTYDSAGTLRGTSFNQHYDRIDRAEFNLIPIGQVATYRGLIFGNWDPHAGSLNEHLGGVTWYLDLIFGRTPGGVSVIGPPQRWVIETNWKVTALNFLDGQHGVRTHVGPISIGQDSGGPPLAALGQILDATPQLTFPEGHGIVLGAAVAGLPDFFGHPPDVAPLYRKTLEAAQFDQLRRGPPMVGTIFPNTSWVEPVLAVAADRAPSLFLSWRNWQPRGPNKVEVWNWYFAPAEASTEARADMHRTALQTFGAGGIFEDDDAEVWAALSRAIGGSIASRQFIDFSAGRSEAPLSDYGAPGTAYGSTLTEQAQFGFMRRWKRSMDGER